jgi:CRISPR-associated protein Cas1
MYIAWPMIKRTIEISQQAYHLCVRNEQLRLLPRENPGTADAPSIPCEDIGLVVVDEPGVTYTHAALAALLEHDAVLVICGRDHLPAGMLLPYQTHTEVVWRVDDQINASRPVRKRLWRQLVQAKIRAQARNLPPNSAVRAKLLSLARNVKSGDPENLEAQAARAYWSEWLGDAPFHRDPDGDGINALLNYGYAVLRAAVARALVMAGLLPVLGIHHSNRSNAFCLADDLVEPLRPLADARVRECVRAGALRLDRDTKRALLELLTLEVQTADQSGPLMVALHRMVASLVRCYEGTSDRLVIPEAKTCS